MPAFETIDDVDDVEIVSLPLPLDRATLSWLARMTRNDTEAAETIASILRSVREDDEQAHRVLN